MGMILNRNGLLNYGDNDGTVIWRSPLTSEASISTPDIGGGTYTKTGTGQTFDSVLGYKAGASGYYSISNLTDNAKLAYCGQFCFEVETEMIACLDVNSPGSSGGRAQTANEVFLGFTANPASSSNYQLYVSINAKSLQFALGDGSSITTVSTYISDVIGKGSHITIHIAWTCNTFYFFVNGRFINSVRTRAKNLPSPHYRLVLGSYPYSAAVPLISGYIRNLQISSRPVAFTVPYLLSLVQAFGDSYANTVYTTQATTWDMEKSLNMEQEFRKIGMRFGGFSATQSYSGRKVIGSGDAALYLIDNVPTALAAHPTLVVFQAGANDLTTDGTLDDAAFTANMKLMIQQFFGVNGNDPTTVRGMVVCSTPWPPEYPDAAQALLRKPDITTIRDIMAALPAWFDAAYPTLAGRLAFQDTFADFGGFSPDAAQYGPSDYLHPNNKGRYVMGKSWAKGGFKVLMSR
jgi:lysophospholipase L1-like esterase